MNRNTTLTLRGRPGLPLVAGLLAGVVLGGTILSTGFAQQQDQDKLNRFVQTQNLPAAKLFREGRDLVGDEDWANAEGKFRRFVSLYPKDANLDAALYWLAFALTKQEKYDEAEKNLKRLLSEFPRSNWADDARALRAQVAEHSGNSRVIEDSLNEDDVEVKIVALESLFQSNPERGLAYVTEMMKPGSKASARLKEAGIELLRRHGGKQAGALLLDIIRNQTDQHLRVVAIQTLGRTGDETVLPLLKDLANTATDDEVGKAAVFAISRFEGESARALLLELARSGKTVEVRKDAIFWLSQNGDAAMDELMRLYEADRNTEIRKQIVFALKRMGTPRAVARLQEIARGSDDVEVRKDALHWIGQSGDAQAVEFLVQFYDTEKSDEVKQQVIFALSRTEDKRALRKLMDIARHDSSVEMRKQALFWLGRSSDPEAQKFLEDILN
ncbi:MAG TPA: HEAT repeat domain-containing protein [Pyrinomonadaceae bacterium]